jgi:hypothetical protein
VPPVHDLNRIRRAFGRSLNKRVAAISTYNLDAGMSLQPTFHARRLTIRQEIEGSVLLQVNKDRAVGMPFPKGEVIHAKNTGRRSGGRRLPFKMPQQSVRADAKAKGTRRGLPAATRGAESHLVFGTPIGALQESFSRAANACPVATAQCVIGGASERLALLHPSADRIVPLPPALALSCLLAPGAVIPKDARAQIYTVHMIATFNHIIGAQHESGVIFRNSRNLCATLLIDPPRSL